MINITYRSHKEILSEAKKRGLVDYTVYEVENLRKDFECTYEARARVGNDVGEGRHTAKFDAFSTAAKQLAYNLAEKKAIEKAIEQLFPGISIVDRPKPDSYRVKWAKDQIAEGNCTKEEMQEVVAEITGLPDGKKLDDLSSQEWTDLECTILYGFCLKADNDKTRRLLKNKVSTATTKAIKDAQLIFVGKKFIVDYDTVTEAQWGLIKDMIEKNTQSVKQPRYIPIFETNRQLWLDNKMAQNEISEAQVTAALTKSGGGLATLESLGAKQFEAFKYWIEKSARENRDPILGYDTNPFTKIKGYGTSETTSRYQWNEKMKSDGVAGTDIVSATRQATSGRTGNLSELSPEEFTSVQRIIKGSDDAEYGIQEDSVFKSTRGTWIQNNRGDLTMPEIQGIITKVARGTVNLRDMTSAEWRKFKSAVKANQPKSERRGLDPTIVSLVSRMRTRNFDDLTDYEYAKASKIAQMCEDREPTSEDREAYLERLLKNGVPWGEIQMQLGTASGRGIANCLDLTEEQWYTFKQSIDSPYEPEPKKVLRKFNFDE